MEVETAAQAYTLQSKVQEDTGFLKDSHPFGPSPYIKPKEDVSQSLYPESFGKKSADQVSEKSVQERPPFSQLFDREEQEKLKWEAFRRQSFADKGRSYGEDGRSFGEDRRRFGDDGRSNGDKEKELEHRDYRDEETNNGVNRQTDIEDKDGYEPEPRRENGEKMADTVSPHVTDVVDKVMSEDNSLIENQESYNLSNASFNDTNSNSSDAGSEFISNHVTSESTTTYVRDPTTGHVTSIKPDKEGVYFCHLCSFSGRTQLEFENHMTCHFEHICPHCDYKSRTEGRLKRHIKDFHTDDPPDGFGSKRNMGRPKVFRCKQCDFVATEKTEFWAHARAHIKDDKVLQCPRCPFVTEYKHHLEYHLRNHFGSKPFKCNKCNYSCVNKSMLNSHMKSHTNVYQYRCADCTYATKYCHSLKLHLRKYQHKPATVLNTDGSLPQGIDADASGLSLLQKRGPPRGPRGPRKDKFDPFMNSMFNLPQSPIHGLPPGMSSAMMSPYWPLLSQLPNGFHRPPPLVPTSLNSPMTSLNSSLHSPQIPHHMPKMASPQTPDNTSNHSFKCNFCCYGSTSKQELYRHLMKVHASENQDLFSMFGLSSENLLEEQNRRLSMIRKEMSERSFDDSMEEELQVQTEGDPEDQKSSPHSWSHPSPGEPAKISRNNRYSMPELPLNYYRNGNTSPIQSTEGEDIIKQMMNKFGSGSAVNSTRPKFGGLRESPLDLTKRKYPFTSSPLSQDDMRDGVDGDNHSSGESTTANENNGQTPRKRSRKGKAFKLDRLCLKLQDKHAEGEIDSDNEDAETADDSGPIGELQIDESRNEGKNVGNTEGIGKEKEEADDIEDIKNSLQYLNEGMNEKEADRKSPDSTRNNMNEDEMSPKDVSSSQDAVSSSPRPSGELNRLKHETEVAWRMIQSGRHQLPQTAMDHNGHHHNLMKLSTAAHQMMAMNNKQGGPNGKYECIYCEIAFKDCVMYTMHMGYHGYKDPFKCNMCGHCSKDKVDFFLHIARAAHN